MFKIIFDILCHSDCITIYDC